MTIKHWPRTVFDLTVLNLSLQVLRVSVKCYALVGAGSAAPSLQGNVRMWKVLPVEVWRKYFQVDWQYFT